MSQWWTKGGKFVVHRPASYQPHGSGSALPLRRGLASRGSGRESSAQCLAQHGYTQWTSYQPASRFWPFQWIEGGWLLALSVLLIAATVWLVRRRAT